MSPSSGGVHLTFNVELQVRSLPRPLQLASGHFLVYKRRKPKRMTVLVGSKGKAIICLIRLQRLLLELGEGSG